MVDAEPTDPEDRAHWDAIEEATELLHEERFHEALVTLRDILRRDPKNPYAYYFLGVGLVESGELEAARDAYSACLRLAPKHLGARVSLCHVLRALGDLRGAIRQGTLALEQVPNDPDSLHALGLAHLARGDKAAARRTLTACLEAGPDFEVATAVRGLLESLATGSSSRT